MKIFFFISVILILISCNKETATYDIGYPEKYWKIDNEDVIIKQAYLYSIEKIGDKYKYLLGISDTQINCIYTPPYFGLKNTVFSLSFMSNDFSYLPANLEIVPDTNCFVARGYDNGTFSEKEFFKSINISILSRSMNQMEMFIQAETTTGKRIYIRTSPLKYYHPRILQKFFGYFNFLNEKNYLEFYGIDSIYYQNSNTLVYKVYFYGTDYNLYRDYSFSFNICDSTNSHILSGVYSDLSTVKRLNALVEMNSFYPNNEYIINDQFHNAKIDVKYIYGTITEYKITIYNIDQNNDSLFLYWNNLGYGF